MAEQSRVYGNFRGVDFTSDPAQVSPYRFSYSVNMWKDYESQNGIAVETFPGYRRLATAGGNMNGIHKFGNKIYCHIDGKLYLLDEKLDGDGKFEGNFFTQKAEGLADNNSTSFVWGDMLYILDGEDYWVFDGDKLSKVSEKAYTPTVTKNDTEYEQKNILTNKYNEAISVPSLESTHSPNLTFSEHPFYVDDKMEETYSAHALTDADEIDYGVLKIPKYDTSGGTTKLIEGIAFWGTKGRNITDIILPSSIRFMSWSAFANYPSLKNVWFDGTQTQWERLLSHYGAYQAVSAMEAVGVAFHINETPTVDVLYTPKDVSGGTIDMKNIGTFIGDDWYINFQYVENGPLGTGSYLSVSNIEKAKTKSIVKTYTDGTTYGYFTKCTLVQSFNGNLFFSGNSVSPNKIWWCAAPADTSVPDPSYIGEFNDDLCGLDDSPIVSMMAQSSALTVFKQKSDQDATIYYYTPIESSSDLVPSRYGESEGGSGIACVGASCNFLDDAVFLSKRGLEGIQKTAVNLERSVVHRSSLVDAKLQAEDLSSAFLLEWKGYLCILFPNGHMYLADSRRSASGNEGTEYEWFYVEGLKGYANDAGYELYGYADAADLYQLSLDGVVDIDGNDLKVNESASIDDIVSGEVMSTTINGKTVYYENETYYLCQRLNEEYADEGGEKITCATVIDDVLYFGAGGSIYCINTDKRENGEIPTKWYTFCGRRYPSGFITFADNCGAPHLRKKTIKKSVVVKTKSIPHSKFYFKIGTDRVPFGEEAEVHTSGELDFSDLGFDAVNLFAQKKSVIPFRSSAKKFVEVQFMFYSDGFRRPFGVYNMAFRFEVTGRVKE